MRCVSMSIIDQCLRLYEGDAYYVNYPAREVLNEYWTDKADPDGRIRDIRSERDLRRADVAYIAEYLNTLPGGRIVDVGCGLGELLEQVDKRHERIGLDLSDSAVAATGALEGVRAIRVALADDTFEAGSCRAIVAHHVIEHIEDPVSFVRAVHRNLVTGGVFICGTPNFASAAARVYGERFRLLHDPTHVSLFTDDSLLRLLRDEGFQIHRVEYPFFGSRYATSTAFERMTDGSGDVSPPFWGSFVTVFAKKSGRMANG